MATILRNHPGLAMVAIISGGSPVPDITRLTSERFHYVPFYLSNLSSLNLICRNWFSAFQRNNGQRLHTIIGLCVVPAFQSEPVISHRQIEIGNGFGNSKELVDLFHTRKHQ